MKPSPYPDKDQTDKARKTKGQQIRRTLHNDEWWFAVSDVVEALTSTPNATDYIKKMRKRDNELSQGWGQIVTPLSLMTEGGNQIDLFDAGRGGYNRDSSQARHSRAARE